MPVNVLSVGDLLGTGWDSPVVDGVIMYPYSAPIEYTDVNIRREGRTQDNAG